MTLNVRIGPDVNELVIHAMGQGLSKRAAVEYAIRSTYGNGSFETGDR